MERLMSIQIKAKARYWNSVSTKIKEWTPLLLFLESDRMLGPELFLESRWTHKAPPSTRSAESNFLTQTVSFFVASEVLEIFSSKQV